MPQSDQKVALRDSLPYPMYAASLQWIILQQSSVTLKGMEVEANIIALPVTDCAVLCFMDTFIKRSEYCENGAPFIRQKKTPSVSFRAHKGWAPESSSDFLLAPCTHEWHGNNWYTFQSLLDLWPKFEYYRESLECFWCFKELWCNVMIVNGGKYLVPVCVT